ncbi:unnamed protein product [Allacma fusca]|uniref:Uncharacterized protein n=1 Tax=Allacma fusca TaxID=39272 RepID=A0A8J2LQF0_9HEXA|nr:unnamed protein product [Allacma fusca]
MDPNNLAEIIGLVRDIKARTLDLMEEAQTQVYLINDILLTLQSSDNNYSNTDPVTRYSDLQNDITSSPYFIPLLDGFENAPLLLNETSMFEGETLNSTMPPSEMNVEGGISNETPATFWDSTLLIESSHRPVKRKIDVPLDEPEDRISTKRPKLLENPQSNLRLTVSKKRPLSKYFSDSEIMRKRRKGNFFDPETIPSKIDIKAVRKFKRTLDEIDAGLKHPLKIRSVISEYGTKNSEEFLNENNNNYYSESEVKDVRHEDSE